MKKIINFALLFVCFSTIAQTPQSLVNETKLLYKAFDEIDIDKLSEMLCSPGDESAYDQLDAYFLNENDKFRFVFTNANYQYSPVKIVNGKSYSTISFRNVIRVTYFKTIDPVALKLVLKAKFNAKSVVYEKDRNSFLIVYTAKMTAISETGNAPWIFTFNDNTLPTQIGDGCITDATLRKELGIN